MLWLQMIELDKLVYKPGDEMRARVIAVDPSLMPATSQDGGKVRKRTSAEHASGAFVVGVCRV